MNANEESKLNHISLVDPLFVEILLPKIKGLSCDPAIVVHDTAAVVMLFIPPPTSKGDAHIVFTKRTTTVGSHKGQISFPGGLVDETDETFTVAALRELKEELNVNSEIVTVHGVLSGFKSITNLNVHCVVATANIAVGDMRANTDEVARVFSKPWTELKRDAARSFTLNFAGVERKSWAFATEEEADPIWGLTAQMLYQADLR